MLKAHNGKAPAGGEGSQKFDLRKAISRIQNTQGPGGSPVGNVAPFQPVGGLIAGIVLRALCRGSAGLDR
jgi:hypothetical protein